jgi:hypothetical protein
VQTAGHIRVPHSFVAFGAVYLCVNLTAPCEQDNNRHHKIVAALINVRCDSRRKQNPQCHCEVWQEFLRSEQIKYVFFGKHHLREVRIAHDPAAAAPAYFAIGRRAAR